MNKHRAYEETLSFAEKAKRSEKQRNLQAQLRHKRKADRLRTIEEIVEKVSRGDFSPLIESEEMELEGFGEVQAEAQEQSKNAAVYEKAISRLPECTCCCCRRFLFHEQVRSVAAENESTEFCKVATGDSVCQTCHKKLSTDKIPSRSYENSLKVELAPRVLTELNFLERRFVAKIQTFMTLLKLDKGGQYAQKGLAVHFVSSPSEICCILPKTAVNAGIVCISGRYKGFIRPSAIYAALRWLKSNNRFYRDIDIDADALIEFNDEGSFSAAEFAEIVETGTISIDYEFPNLSLKNFTSVHLPKIQRSPTSFFEFSHTEAMAYPWLFPYGNFDIDSERQERVRLLDYLQSRFLLQDSRFRCDIGYLITAVNRYEEQRLKSLVDLYMNSVKKVHRQGEINTMREVTAGDLRSSDGSDLSKNSTMFMKSIRGTAAYWKDELYNLLARIKCLGDPTLFLTLSVDDMGWEELQAVLRYDLGSNYTNAQDAVRKDPVMVAIYAERRLHEILKLIKAEKPFGEVEDYYVRKEWQSRGSVHFHIFLWIKDAPSLEKESSEADIIAFIDKCISTELPDPEKDPELYKLVSEKQTHHHTHTCKLFGKRSQRECRFHYPRRECEQTRLLAECDRHGSKHQFYETKRGVDDIFINAFNLFVIRHNRSNMDIQIIYGEKGVVHYLMDYLVKAEPTELRSELLKLLNEMDDCGQLTQKARMYKLGFCMLKTRRMCAQEAVYRICHLPMIESSRTLVKINTSSPVKRFRKVKAKTDIKDLPDESTEIFEDNVLVLYRDRPESLENVSFFNFASWYEKCCEGTKDSQACISGKRYIKKKTKFSCVRNIFHNSSSDEYYYNLLLLHLPHRTDVDILSDGEIAEQVFLAKQEMLDIHNLSNERLVNEVMEASQRLLAVQALNSTEGDDSDSDSLEEEQWMEMSDENCFEKPSYENYAGGDVPTENRGDPFTPEVVVEMEEADISWHNMIANSVSAGKIHECIKKLSKDQLRVLKYSHKIMFMDKAQLLLYIGGNAGTGKSHLLMVFVEWCRLNARKFAGHDPVVVCAPTGIAAKNIKGNTLHSTFKLPVQHNSFDRDYSPLNGKSLIDLRQKLRDKSVLVVDEISMVSDKMLKCVHRRLQEIHNNQLMFGGISVVLTGDFLQLRPVKGKYAFCCKELFDEFAVLWLSQNVRQEEDKRWCALLDNIQVGKISEKNSEMLQSRCFTAEELVDEKVDIRLYPKLRMVQEYNRCQQNELNPNCLTMHSTDLYSQNDIESGCQISESNLPEDDRDAGGLLHVLKLSKFSRVMLIKNMDENLVNGSMGFVHDFVVENNIVTRIYVKFDDKESGLSRQNPNYNNAIGIDPVCMEYIFHARYMSRKQFPLMPAWAVTIHKAEGLSLNSAVVNISECFSAGQAYVALSRIRSVNGVFIEQGANKEKLSVSKIFADKKAIEEIVQFKARAHLLKNQPWLKHYKVMGFSL